MRCRCNQCLTLFEYMRELTGRTDYGLAPAPGHPQGETHVNRCDGTMTCTCERCEAQRELIAKHGRSRDRPQPWEPKRAAA